MKYIVLILLLLSSQAIYSKSNEPGVYSKPGGWVTKDGSPVENTDAMKSINGFGGWLVVTPDKDWEDKWNTPPNVTPSFTEAKEVSYGEQLTVLPFYINPKINAFGDQRVLCDIRVIRPDGSYSIDAEGVECAVGKIRGNPKNVRLTSALIKYIGEDGDPPGKWTVEINMIDVNRGVTVPLKAHFTLTSEKSR